METAFCMPWLQRRTRPEEAWVAAARLSEPWALERFYTSYRDLVYSLCFRLTGSSEDAEDATQATFIRAFRDLPRFRGDSSLKTWVYRIALNEALGLRRKQRDLLELTETSADVGDAAASVVEGVAVRSALERLSEEHRIVLVLQFWEGLSGPEIAEVLGISLPAVKMRLHRARAEFRKSYEGAV